MDRRVVTAAKLAHEAQRAVAGELQRQVRIDRAARVVRLPTACGGRWYATVAGTHDRGRESSDRGPPAVLDVPASGGARVVLASRGIRRASRGWRAEALHSEGSRRGCRLRGLASRSTHRAQAISRASIGFIPRFDPRPAMKELGSATGATELGDPDRVCARAAPITTRMPGHTQRAAGLGEGPRRAFSTRRWPRIVARHPPVPAGEQHGRLRCRRTTGSAATSILPRRGLHQQAAWHARANGGARARRSRSQRSLRFDVSTGAHRSHSSPSERGPARSSDRLTGHADPARDHVERRVVPCRRVPASIRTFATARTSYHESPLTNRADRWFDRGHGLSVLWEPRRGRRAVPVACASEVAPRARG